MNTYVKEDFSGYFKVLLKKRVVENSYTFHTTMFKNVREYFLAVVFLSLIKEYFFQQLAQVSVFTHCTQTATDILTPTPKIIIPRRINEINDTESDLVEDKRLSLDLCPDKRFLKVSWNAYKPQGKDTRLCYEVFSVRNEILMGLTCFSLNLHKRNQSSAMNCWFPMKHIDKRPTIKAWVHQSSTNLQLSYTGSLDTSDLDPVYSCKDTCEVVPMQISSQINCKDTASIFHDTSTIVKHLSFHVIGKTSCDSDIIHIPRQTKTRIEFRLNCEYNGLGHIKVLYSIQDKYCLKYQQVRVNCSRGNSSTMPQYTVSMEHGNIHSFGTFVIFGIVCVIVIATIFFSIIFVVQWLIYLRIKYRISRRGSKEDSRNASIGLDDIIPLNRRTSEHKESNNTDQPYEKQEEPKLSRKHSSPEFRSTSFSSTQVKAETEQKLVCRPIRKSVTMALLEDTNPFYKKKILFLPKPYDHFTHGATKILKFIFYSEAGITSECCYDRGIHKHYMTSNRERWISNVLGDHDRILIFLCFKSLSAPPIEAENESMVDEIIDKLLLSKTTSTILCKIVFLHLSECPKIIQKKHHGDNFNIHDANSYQNFVGDVLNYCRRGQDEYQEMINRISNCQTSSHFLKYIGLTGTTHSKTNT